MLRRRIARTALAALVALGLTAPAPALAQDLLGPEYLRVSEIVGSQVTGPRGENLGKIQDLVIDSRTRKVEYVALGDGRELFAYPVSALSAGAAAQVVLDVPPASLPHAKGFNDAMWQELRDDRSYWTALDRRFGASRDAQSSAGASVATLSEAPVRRLDRVTEWVGRRAQDRSGKDAGRVADLVVSVWDGQIRFALMDAAGNGTLVRVPIDSLVSPQGLRTSPKLPDAQASGITAR